MGSSGYEVPVAYQTSVQLEQRFFQAPADQKQKDKKGEKPGSTIEGQIRNPLFPQRSLPGDIGQLIRLPIFDGNL